MPDRDKIHPQLPRKYYIAYKQICEAHESDEEIARTACKGLRKDIKEYGDVPLKMIDLIEPELERVICHPLFLRSVDWGELSRKVDESNQKTGGNSRAKATLSDACKSYIHSIRFGDILSEDPKKEIIAGYIGKIYNSNFEEMIPLNQNHPNGETHENICERLKRIKPHVESHIKDFTEKILRTGTVKSLSDPKHPRSGQPIDIFADIRDL